MKITAVAFLLLMLSNSLFSQVLKHYQGPFEGKSIKGISNYTYIENSNYERIYEGLFSFSSSNNSLKISGTLQNGKKNGIWHFVANNFSQQYGYKNMGVKNVSFNVYGGYNKGNMEGPWILKRNITTIYSETVEENSVANFKNNHLDGSFSFSYKCNKTNKYVTVKGSFDDNGEKTGEWLLNYSSSGIRYQKLTKYNHDTLTFDIIRNISNGDVLFKFENGIMTNNSTNNEILKRAMNIDIPINFWINGSFYYHGYQDLFMYSFGGLFEYNPIFEITKGSNVDENRSLLR